MEKNSYKRIIANPQYPAMKMMQNAQEQCCKMFYIRFMWFLFVFFRISPLFINRWEELRRGTKEPHRVNYKTLGKWKPLWHTHTKHANICCIFRTPIITESRSDVLNILLEYYHCVPPKRSMTQGMRSFERIHPPSSTVLFQSKAWSFWMHIFTNIQRFATNNALLECLDVLLSVICFRICCFHFHTFVFIVCFVLTEKGGKKNTTLNIFMSFSLSIRILMFVFHQYIYFACIITRSFVKFIYTQAIAKFFVQDLDIFWSFAVGSSLFFLCCFVP